MYKLCKTEQSTARQHELEHGLLTAMSTRRFEDISVSDLCDQLGVPRKSFYRYFSSKDGALQALIDHTLMEYECSPLLTAPGEPRTQQKEMERFFLFWLQKRLFLDAMTRNNLTGMLINRSVTYALSGAPLPRPYLLNEPKEVQDHVVTFAVCGLISLMLNWYQGGFVHSPRYMARLAVRLISQPLFPDVNAPV